MPNRLFVPSSEHPPPAPRIDEADEIHDVIACVTVHGARGEVELVIGLDLGRVIRVVAARRDELPARARAQLDFHEKTRPRFHLHVDELYVMDVQAIERQPDAPGADDPMFLYGMLRGPYPAGLSEGVVAREGQLATTRGPLLDGLACGIERAFVYEHGRCGESCVHALLPADSDANVRAAVLAFPLVPMGDDGSNELVAAQLAHDVLGALRVDLGDDLSKDPVPVPDRARYEQELVAAGWTIQDDMAVHRGGKNRFASLFTPAKKQKLPAEARLADYGPLLRAQVARLPGWATVSQALHEQLGDRPRARPPTPPSPPRTRPPTGPPPIPPRARPRPPTPPVAPPPPRGPRVRVSAKTAPRTVAKGLTPELTAARWMQKLVEEHRAPDRPPPRVTVPARAAGATVPDWMLDLIESEFPDD